MKEKDFKIRAEGKYIVQLEELNRYIVLNKLLLTLEEGKKGKVLCIYEIKKSLTEKDFKLLNKNFNSGMKKISSKLCENGPVAITDGNFYYGDLMGIKTENNKAFLIVF